MQEEEDERRARRVGSGRLSHCVRISNARENAKNIFKTNYCTSVACKMCNESMNKIRRVVSLSVEIILVEVIMSWITWLKPL